MTVLYTDKVNNSSSSSKISSKDNNVDENDSNALKLHNNEIVLASLPDKLATRMWYYNELYKFKSWYQDHTQDFIIISPHCTVPDWIEFQIKSIQKYIQVPVSLIILNDANHDLAKYKDGISQVCRDYNLYEIIIHENIHKHRDIVFPQTQEPDVVNAVTKCATSTQIAWDFLCVTNGYGLILDSDCVFFDKFNPVEYLGEYTLAGVSQSRSNNVHYIWNALVLANFATIPDRWLMNFDCGKINGEAVDAGGHAYFYLEKYPDYKRMERTPMNEDNPYFPIDQWSQENNTHCGVEVWFSAIDHFRNGGNWLQWPEELFNERIKLIRQYTF